MQRSLLPLTLAALALTQVIGSTAEPQAVKIFAQGDWPLPVHTATAPARERQQSVLRSEKELARLAGPHGLAAVRRSLKVEAIDFDKHMLLAVSDGTLPMVGVSGGGPPSVPNRIEIAHVVVEDGGKTLHVSWRLSPRVKDELITLPLEVVLLDHFDGEVKFDRLPVRTEAPARDGKPAFGKALKVLARAFWPDGWKAEEPARQWTLRSRDELIDPRLRAPEQVLERMRQEQAARYAKALKVGAIDFDKQMIVGVSAGVQPGPGYRVEIVRVEKDAKDNRLTVRWRLHSPKEKKPEGGLTHPAAVALVEQSAGTVTFAEEPGPGK